MRWPWSKYDDTKRQLAADESIALVKARLEVIGDRMERSVAVLEREVDRLKKVQPQEGLDGSGHGNSI